MMDVQILRDAKEKVKKFDQIGLHYNLVAKEIYCERRKYTAPEGLFKRPFLRYVIAGLISFDMGRMMGEKREKVYEFEDDHFAARLERKLSKVRADLEPLMNLNLADRNLDLGQHEQAIRKAYEELSRKGDDSLDMKHRHFHVGATKVMHFLNPELFIIIDSNAIIAFRKAHSIKSGHPSQEYFQCMTSARLDILTYGVEEFRALDPDTPITRVYDKLTFMTGKCLSKEVGCEDRD